MLPEFELLRPRTLEEALATLAEGAPEVVPIAGGTNVIVDLRGGRFHYPSLMDVSHLEELCGVRQEDGWIVVGGGTTIAELLADALVAEHGAPLREAAAVMANPLIRNRATVAGNLVDGSPAADTAPPLLALAAEVELASREGMRRVPLGDFLVDVRRTLRRPDELVLAVRWPVPPPGSGGGFSKLGLRKGTACSVVSAAVVVEANGDGRCREARIGLGAVAPTAIRAREAEEVLRGSALEPETIERAGELAVEASAPIDDVRAAAAYRSRVVGVLVRRLLERVAGELYG